MNVPPLAAARLAAIVAGTYTGGNDLRSLDALVKRGLVVLSDRTATLTDTYKHRRNGDSVTVTPLGLDWIRSRSALMEWVEANRTDRCLL